MGEPDFCIICENSCIRSEGGVYHQVEHSLEQLEELNLKEKHRNLLIKLKKLNQNKKEEAKIMYQVAGEMFLLELKYEKHSDGNICIPEDKCNDCNLYEYIMLC